MRFKQKLYLSTYRKAVSPVTLEEDLASVNFKRTKLIDHKYDKNGFDEWIALNDWEHRFPSYFAQWRPPRQPEGTALRKLNEHFISTELGQLNALSKTDIIIDVAAAASPFQEVLAGLGYQNAFKSDLNFETDLDKKRLGGAGSAYLNHFDDETVSLMVAHNSIEHFERGEDLALFKQINRVLRIGGRFVWLPLGLRAGGLNETDPTCWDNKYSNASQWPRFERRYPLFVNNRKQRLMKWWDPMHLESRLRKFAPNCDITIFNLIDAVAGRYCLVLEKRE